MPTSIDYVEIRSLHDLYRCMEGKKKAIFRYIVVEGEPREDFVGEICMIEYEDGSLQVVQSSVEKTKMEYALATGTRT